MKTTIFYTVTFLAFLLAKSSMTGQCQNLFHLSIVAPWTVWQLARFFNRKVLKLRQFLISFSFETRFSQVATLTAIVKKIRSIITAFGTELPRLYFWINCNSSRGASFSTVNCTLATSYNCDATITFFSIVQQWTTVDATTVNIYFSATQPPV